MSPAARQRKVEQDFLQPASAGLKTCATLNMKKFFYIQLKGIHRLLHQSKSNCGIPYSNIFQPSRLSNITNASGAVLLTIVILIIIIGITGVAIYSLTTTTTFSQVGSRNAAQAYYLAESGFRVVASEYNQASEANKNSVLENLHGKTLTLSGKPGQFEARLYPTWFYVSAGYTHGGSPDTIRVKLPGGIPVQDPENPTSAKITIPDTCELKLQGKTQHAVITGKTPANPDDGDEITFTLNPGFPYDIAAGETLFLVYTDTDTGTLNPSTISLGSDLILDGANDVAKVLPKKNGSFRIDNFNNEKLDYTYKDAVFNEGPPPAITLSDLGHQNPDDPSAVQFTVNADTQLLIGKNLTIATTASVGEGPTAGEKTVVNFTDVGVDAGFFTGKDTISFAEDIQDFSPKMGTGGTPIAEGAGDAPITVDTTAKEIELGKNLGSRYGSVWYAGDTDIANCIEGRCNLGKGLRAYFEFQFNDTDDDSESKSFGDGFTFSIISGYEDSPGNYRNTADDTGSGGEYLGYAGPGLDDGLQPPKIGIEFDTYPNPGAGNICSSDSRRDDTPVANHVAAVYWGQESVGSFSAISSTNLLSNGGGFLRIGSATPPNGADEDWSSFQGTISFWFKRNTLRSTDRIWGQNSDMEARFDGGNFVLDWGDDNSLVTSNPFTTPGKWYFIAIIWNELDNYLRLCYGDETTLPSLYDENNNWTSSISAVGIRENLFMNSSGGVPVYNKNYIVNGSGSDLRYYNIARSLFAIQADYGHRLTGEESGLRAYFPLQADLVDAGPLKIGAYPIGTTEWSADTPDPFNVCNAPAATYDDNRHGSGGITTPLNSLNTEAGSGNDGYHRVAKEVGDPNWLEDGEIHNLRIELIRPLTPSGDGNYDYQFKIWIDCGGDCSLLTATELEDYRAVIGDYTFTASLPQIQKTLKLSNPLEVSPAIHEDLKKILFGFTEGTGGATQNITLSNFELHFLKTYPVANLATW